jgi:ArsR family transcriptional regulator, arsenate/arsenite/antimonite-responsive transcriptional repressor
MVAMNTIAFSANALAALGHVARLEVYRLLVRTGGDGLIVGDIASHTGQPLSTLAHHLRTLVSAGLVTQQRRGREIVNRVDFATMNAVMSFLTTECCKGVGTTAQDAA